MAYDRMAFEDVLNVFDAMFNAFHPMGLEDDEGPDRRMTSLFDIFLEFAHWKSEEFWEAYDNHEHECPECSAKKEEQTKKETN